MISLDNRTEFDFDIAPLERIAASLSEREIELILVGDEEICELNRDYRNLNEPTDVLSFPIDDFAHAPLGSIVISVETAARQAAQFGHTAAEEIAVLFLHGVLHLLGYDHETDSGEMAAQEALRRVEFGLSTALTERV
ncbi:endoribonuclease YbeY [Campylobacterota bacterium]|nr:endoribonuclease YbeY [Campylobacterota bacterium]